MASASWAEGSGGRLIRGLTRPKVSRLETAKIVCDRSPLAPTRTTRVAKIIFIFLTRVSSYRYISQTPTANEKMGMAKAKKRDISHGLTG